MKKILLVLLLFSFGFFLKAQNYSNMVKIKQVSANHASTKTITIRLNGIFMGECGNGNNCTHEPVAGWVTATLNKLSDRGNLLALIQI